MHRLADVSRTPLHISNLELYTEVAWLRDYWFSLGDFKNYDSRLNERREQHLHRVLEIHLGDLGQVGHVLTGQFIRTKTGRIQSPGRWAIDDIDAFSGPAGPEQSDTQSLNQKLRELKWAYNAKPDLLVLSDRKPVFVEAKVESGIDFNKASGYNQARISQVIRRLMHVVSGTTVVDTQNAVGLSGIAFISRKQEKDPESKDPLATILWKDIAHWAEASPGLDPFTRTGLRQFAKRAQAEDLKTD